MKVQYDEDNILGRGCNSIVFRGTFNRQPVAVKRIQLIDARGNGEDEADLASLHHPNVAKLLHSESDTHFKYCVLELCAASFVLFVCQIKFFSKFPCRYSKYDRKKSVKSI